MPHMIAVQEAHIKPGEIRIWESEFYSKIVCAYQKRGAGMGVLLAFRDTLDCEITSHIADPEGWFVAASVSLEGEQISIVNVHLCPMAQEDIREVLPAVGEAVVQLDNERVIWCGDFNCVRDPALDGSRPMNRNITVQQRNSGIYRGLGIN